eukprot:TRINITY_DN37251_c0_g1_i2.p1 TRINITY_DN37251_c0_g1~~TRINITY_DN37251_c0_g1_i2.p1  ORF type:complete len:517 (+),score=118.23 TRINITY_DN37251_c0_g1_i2:102-1652(+)
MWKSSNGAAVGYSPGTGASSWRQWLPKVGIGALMVLGSCAAFLQLSEVGMLRSVDTWQPVTSQEVPKAGRKSVMLTEDMRRRINPLHVKDYQVPVLARQEPASRRTLTSWAPTLFGQPAPAKVAAASIAPSEEAARDDEPTSSPEMVKEGSREPSRWQFLHVYGLHHTGTGMLQRLAEESLGKSEVSLFHNTRVSEDEGQHLQSVFPSVGHRNRENCGDYSFVVRLYFCPKMMELMSKDVAEKLFLEWGRYWNLKKKVLVQKTPHMGFLFLEKAFPKSHHLIVMRHPMFWRLKEVAGPYKLGDDPSLLFLNWMIVWNRTMTEVETLSRFMVVRFEDYVLHWSAFELNIRKWMGFVEEDIPIRRRKRAASSSGGASSPTTDWGPARMPSNWRQQLADRADQGTSTPPPNADYTPKGEVAPRGRRLEVHNDGKVASHLLWKKKGLALVAACRRQPRCLEVGQTMQPCMRHLGYTAFHPMLAREQHWALFSEKRLPPLEVRLSCGRALTNLEKVFELPF